jgi:hypothetical protein
MVSRIGNQHWPTHLATVGEEGPSKSAIRYAIAQQSQGDDKFAMADGARGELHVQIRHEIAVRILGDPGSRDCGSSTCINLDLSCADAQAFSIKHIFLLHL